VLAKHRFAGGVDHIDVHGGVICRFRAGNDALAAIAKVRANSHGQAEGYRATQQHSDRGQR
jgi:hypothetical protein